MFKQAPNLTVTSISSTFQSIGSEYSINDLDEDVEESSPTEYKN